MPTALVTGATGFVGTALLARLLAGGWTVRGAVRSAGARLPAGVAACPAGDADWSAGLPGADVVFHLAARVHQMDDRAADPLAEFRRVNTEATERLARAAAAAGARRLVFVSSVKVNGGERERPYDEDDAPAPGDPYGQSKREAEERLAAVARETGLEVVVLRPPLVYGPGVRANMASLLRAVQRGLPLPLGAVRNRRSLVYVENLADCLERCGADPRAAGRTFLVSDGEDVSTPELVRRIARAFGRPARLLPVPVALLRAAAGLAGKGPAVERLAGSLAVDSSRVREVLGWTPPCSLDEGLRRTVAAFAGGGGRAGA